MLVSYIFSSPKVKISEMPSGAGETQAEGHPRNSVLIVILLVKSWDDCVVDVVLQEAFFDEDEEGFWLDTCNLSKQDRLLLAVCKFTSKASTWSVFQEKDYLFIAMCDTWFPYIDNRYSQRWSKNSRNFSCFCQGPRSSHPNWLWGRGYIATWTRNKGFILATWLLQWRKLLSGLKPSEMKRNHTEICLENLGKKKLALRPHCAAFPGLLRNS